MAHRSYKLVLDAPAESQFSFENSDSSFICHMLFEMFELEQAILIYRLSETTALSRPLVSRQLLVDCFTELFDIANGLETLQRMKQITIFGEMIKHIDKLDCSFKIVETHVDFNYCTVRGEVDYHVDKSAPHAMFSYFLHSVVNFLKFADDLPEPEDLGSIISIAHLQWTDKLVAKGYISHQSQAPTAKFLLDGINLCSSFLWDVYFTRNGGDHTPYEADVVSSNDSKQTF